MYSLVFRILSPRKLRHGLTIFLRNQKEFKNLSSIAVQKTAMTCQTAKIDAVSNSQNQKQDAEQATTHRIIVPHNTLIASLKSSKSVLEQIHLLNTNLGMSKEEIAFRLDLCKYLEAKLRPYFPNCQIHLIGSSMSGLGFKHSDLDVSFQPDRDSVGQVEPLIFDIPSVSDVENGTFPASKIKHLPHKFQLRFVRRVLRLHCVEMCKEPIILIAGRCPILRFHFGPDNLKCDLGLNNRLGVETTRLLYICGKIDSRFISLTRAINYWAKHADLVGPFQKFKSYAFSLLVIFYLQKRNPPILPPLEDLKKSNFFREQKLQNLNLEAVNLLFKSDNKESLDELFKDFFFYYLFFDFNEALCPLSGQSVNKAKLSFQVDITEQKFEMSSICIQDPLHPEWNVTTGTHFKFCRQLVQEILTVCQLYQNEMWCPSGSTTWGLASVLDCFYSSSYVQEGPFVLDIPMITSPCSQVATVLDVLTYGLLFECTVQKTYNCELINRPNKLISFHHNVDLSECHKCNRTHSHTGGKSNVKNSGTCPCYLNSVLKINNTWYGRSMVDESCFSNNSNSNRLELEHSISKRILLEKPKDSRQAIDVRCHFTEILIDQQPVLRITMSSVVNQNRFPPTAAVFLKEFLPNIVRELLK